MPFNNFVIPSIIIIIITIYKYVCNILFAAIATHMFVAPLPPSFAAHLLPPLNSSPTTPAPRPPHPRTLTP